MSQDNALREARYCLEQLKRIQGWEDPADADEEQSNWSVYQRTIEALEGFEQAALATPSAGAPDVVPGLVSALEGMVAEWDKTAAVGIYALPKPVLAARAALDAARGERT